VPKARLPYTFVVKDRYWQFRRGKLRSPLPGKPGDAVFHEAYGRLLALSETKPQEPNRASLAWLIKQYKNSAEFEALATPTQDDYGKTLKLLVAEMGDEPFRLITRAMVKAVRDDHAATARKAHKIKQMVSCLYIWAGENDHVVEGHNPAASIKRFKKRVKPITPWSEEDIVLFLKHCPAFLKTPILLALYTGQRREDIVQMDWMAFQGPYVRVRQSKTGEPLDIACHRELRKHLSSVKTDFGGPIARTAKGRPFTPNSLSQAIRRIVLGIDDMPDDRSIHGLRYAAAARLDEAGCTVAQAVSVMGHRTYQMAIKYMGQRAASRAAVTKQEQNN